MEKVKKTIYAKIGQKGGKKTRKLYGIAYFRKIRRKGIKKYNQALDKKTKRV